MKQVKLSVEYDGFITIINISGHMNISEVQKFEKQIDKLIKSDHLNIILDLSELAYISSSGLGSIVGYIREVRKLGGDIKIGGVSDRVNEILETFGFSAIFEMFLSRAEAIEKFKRK